MAIISDPFPLRIVYCFRYAYGDREEMASRSSISRVFSLGRPIQVGQHQIALGSLKLA